MSRGEATPLERLLALPPGERRLGPFVLDRQLGRGGFAPVWLAREIHGETCLRSAALKLFNVEREADRFAAVIEEARVLASVVHPNVVNFYQLVLDEGRGVVGVAMELVSGESVARQLAQRRRLPIDEVVRVGVAVASALSAVHRAGLVHRDVKPENVVAAGGTYKLIDFGIASASRPAPPPRARRVLLDELPIEVAGTNLSETLGAFTPNADDPEGPTLLQDLQGTIGYMDPATVAFGLPESAASDLYGLGVLLFECVIGRLPAVVSAGPRGGMDGAALDGRKRAPGLRSVDPSVPEPLASLVDALLESEPSRRPASEWVLAELERIERAIRESVSQAVPPEDEGPFRGLAGYREADAGVFFQREGEAAAVIELLRRSGLVVIQGRPGSGKSSLVRAGVIPAVHRGVLEPSISRWVVASCLVGRDLRKSVAKALGPVIPRADQLTAGELVAALSEQLKATGTGILLALDQLEDLVTLAGGASRSYAVELLPLLAGTPSGLRCVATLRRDFRQALDDLQGLQPVLARTSFMLNPLSRDAWIEVVARGLRAYGYQADAALVSTLNDAFDEKDMVQRGFVLSMLWRERDRSARTLTSGGRSREAYAVELWHHADACLQAVVDRFGDAAREAARQLLLSLVTPHRTCASREIDEIRTFGEEAIIVELVGTLESAGLIVRDGAGIRLAHEALIHSWVTLGDWYERALKDRVVVEQLERDAARYLEEPSRHILQSWAGARRKEVQNLQRRLPIQLSHAATSFVEKVASYERVQAMSVEARTRSTVTDRAAKATRASGDVRACLVVVHTRATAELGKRIPLDKSPTRLGRSADNEIVVEGDSASRHHAYCERTGHGWILIDNGSRNGTYVNDAPISPSSILRSGDLIRIGWTVFKYLTGPDIEELYNKEIFLLTIRDGLTQAYNRSYLIDVLTKEINLAMPRGYPLGLIVFDIDHLRRINEQHGSLAGDGVLRDIVKGVLPLLLPYHVLARYGEDKFIVLCPESHPAATESLAEWLRETIASRLLTFQGEVLRVTASFGVVQLRPELTSPEDLIREADQKLREAKDAGRNCVVG